MRELATSASLADHWVSMQADYNIEDFDALRSVLVPINHLNDHTIADYFAFLENAPTRGTGENEIGTVRRDIFHPALLDLLKSFVPWESASQREEAYIALYDFICAAIAGRSGLITGRVMSTYEILLSRALACADPIDISHPDPETGRLNILRRWFEITTINELALYRQAPEYDIFENVLNFEIPQLGEVPLAELISFQKKDRVQPLISQASEWARENPQMDADELAQRIQQALWEVAQTLWPTAKKEIIGAFGQIPTGPISVNPLGLVSWLYGVFENRKVKQKYGWVIVVADLKRIGHA